MSMMKCEHGIGQQKPLMWNENGFDAFDMVSIETIGDGSCYFHALANAFYIPYRLQKLNGKNVSRKQIIQDLRQKLAIRLGEPIDPLNPNGPTFYDQLSRGELYDFGKKVPEYSFENMRKRLRSSIAVGNEYHEFVSDQFNKDIYILNADIKDVYITGNDDDLYYKNRNSVVLLNIPSRCHFELVGVKDPKGKIQTYFAPSHPFIQLLQSRMRTLRSS
jgi:hypothetical protein